MTEIIDQTGTGEEELTGTEVGTGTGEDGSEGLDLLFDLNSRKYDLATDEGKQALKDDYANLLSDYTKKSQQLKEYEESDEDDDNDDYSQAGQGGQQQTQQQQQNVQYWQDPQGYIHDTIGNVFAYDNQGQLQLVQQAPPQQQPFAGQSQGPGPASNQPFQPGQQAGQLSSPEYQQAMQLLQNMGFTTKEEAQSLINSVIEQRAFDEHLSSLSYEIDGSDGRPAFDAKKIVKYMQKTGIRNPEDAYELMHKDDLFSWKLEQAKNGGAKLPKTMKKTSPQGPKLPQAKKRPNMESTEFKELVAESLRNSISGGQAE